MQQAMVSWSTAYMPNLGSFAGPVHVTYDSTRALPLVITGDEQSAVGTRLILSFDVQSDPQLPADLCDVRVDGPALSGAQGGQVQLKTLAQKYLFDAKRVFAHRDLRELARDVVPPQPVSLSYRWRWHLGVFLVRLPLLRRWMLARLAKE